MNQKSDLDLFFAIEGKSFNRKTNLKQSEDDYDYEEESNDENNGSKGIHENKQDDKFYNHFLLESNLREHEPNFLHNLQSDDYEMFCDDIFIPEININSIQLDENGNIINADDVIQIQEDDLLKSLKPIKLSHEDEEEIKKHIDFAFNDDNQISLHKKFQKERSNIEKQIKQKEEKNKLVLNLKSLFKMLTEFKLKQQNNESELINQIKIDKLKNLEKINEIDQEITKLENLIRKFNETDLEDNSLDQESINFNKMQLLNIIQQILNLFVNLNIWLFNCGQPPMDGCNIADKSIGEIDNILTKMIERTKIATKTIIS